MKFCNRERSKADIYSLEPALVSARQLSMFFHSPSRQIQTQKVRYLLAPLSLPFSIMRPKCKDSNPLLTHCMTLDKLKHKNTVWFSIGNKWLCFVSNGTKVCVWSSIRPQPPPPLHCVLQNLCSAISSFHVWNWCTLIYVTSTLIPGTQSRSWPLLTTFLTCEPWKPSQSGF